MKYYVDTSVIIAYVIDSDPNHEKAVEVLLDKGDRIISQLTVTELYSVFSRRVKDEIVVESLVNYSIKKVGVKVERIDFNEVFKKVSEIAPKVKLKTLDLLHLIISIILNSEILTLDKELEEAYKKMN
ncbi:type II toxin-antitoxin system VapC family toxin [Acidianus manzaensis]|uniref:Twitching motility protein PilT n=1 Tax=Acidianus manzaensis TaxID=282676 RepID=A0A1W6K2H3_9CREN|nr:PIN domain-containing protein [Acidianus manzaensis]ARM76695.1 twitching motility protein PilT [Acidianus manzaensis]